MTMTSGETDGLLAEALDTIEKLEERLRTAQGTGREEPIAIIGLGCRFPGEAESPEEFWQLLGQGVDATAEFPVERGDPGDLLHPDPEQPGKAYTLRGGFLSSIDQFEPEVFGISPREAVGIDPQHRLLLEVCWEAFERAGYSPQALAGSRTGVFFGLSTTDYVRMRQQVGDIRDVDAYQLVGEPSFAAGRLSFVLGLNGPSKIVDTSCSSSLVALHDACQALRLGECDMALAGGVNLLLTPYGFVIMSKFRALAADGRCKTFDASADGYARGEGVGVVVLKKLVDAVADNDTILAVVRGSAVNHDGRSSGLTVPNAGAQRAVIQSALDRAGIAAGDVDYVEAHGTGTALGDPIELRSLQAVIGSRREPDRPLLVGSVKTNIGHLEPAAGIAGLIKLTLAIQHSEIPPHLNLTVPNPNLDWAAMNIDVPRERTPWPGAGAERVGAVSSFGASGTNAHVVLSRAPEPAPRTVDSAIRPELFVVSARTPESLDELVTKYLALFAGGDAASLADICFTTQVGRAVQRHGLAVTASSVAELEDALAAWRTGNGAGRVRSAELLPHRLRKSVWLFTDNGLTGSRNSALFGEPMYAEARATCAQIFGARATDPEAMVFSEQYATAMLLLSWGIHPSTVAGSGVGELVAACLAGVVDLVDAARILFANNLSAAIAATRSAQPRIPLATYVPGTGLTELHAAGVRTFVTFGSLAPHRLDDPDVALLPSTGTGADDLAVLLTTCGALHLRGLAVDFAAIQQDRDVRRVELPTTPWRRARYWFAPATPESVEPQAQTAVESPGAIPGLGHRLATAIPTYDIDPTALSCGDLVRLAVNAAHDHAGGAWRVITDVVLTEGPNGLDSTDRAHLSLSDRTDDLITWEVFGSTASEQRAGAAWRTLATGAVRRFAEPAPATVPGDAELVVEPEPGREWMTLLEHAHSLLRGRTPAAEVVVGVELLDCAHPAEVRGLRLDDVQPWHNGVGATLTLLGADGSVLGRIAGLHALPRAAMVEPPQRWVDPDDLRYAVDWQPVATLTEPSSVPTGFGILMIADGRDGYPDRLADRLRALGADVTVAAPPEQLDTMANLIDNWRTTTALPAKVLVLTGLSAPEPSDCTADAFETYLQHGDLTLVAVVRALAAHEDTTATKVTVLTRGAHPITDGEAGSPAATTLWGLGKVIALEHPRIWGGIVDLDPDPAADDLVDVVAQILTDDREDQIALRAGGRLAPRLLAQPSAADEPRREPPVRRDGSYLITGAFGGIGQAITRWLARAGAGRLVLLSRTPATGNTEREQLIHDLQRLGADVQIRLADIADETNVATIMSELRSDPLPLLGIIHAAGLSDPEMIAEVTPERYRAVWLPKVVGGWLLHRLAPEDLDFFLGFSSIASTWGSQHLASYASGNAFLTGLAQHRRALGQAATTIEWGPWELPSALFGAEVMDFLKSTGLRPLSAGQCLALLPEALTGSRPDLVYCAVDWSRFKPVMEARIQRPMLDTIKVAEETAAPTAESSAVLAALTAATSVAQTRQVLLDYLTTELAALLDTEARHLHPEADLVSYGLDSLIVMDLVRNCRAELGVSVRAGEIFERATLAEWVELLQERLDNAAAGAESGLSTFVEDEVNATEPSWIESVVGLDSDIVATGIAQRTATPSAVLLTGATGFVGAFLLVELLAKTEAEVHCLIRCWDEYDGMDRLRANLEKYLPWPEAAAARIRILPGDLAAPRLGLDAARFAELATRLDGIYHCGAWVNFSYTFDQLRPANVAGTQELLRLAAAGHAVLHHVSTYGIWGLPADGRSVIHEDTPLAAAGRLVTGYVQTKWAAEHLVELARQRGIAVDVHRPGRVLGDSVTGACLTTHFTTRMIKGCIQLGMAPELDFDIEMTPVDYVASALVEISLRGPAPGRTYHLVNGAKLPWTELVSAMNRYGWHIPTVPVEQWWSALRAEYARSTNELHPVMQVVEEFVVGGEDAIDYDTAATVDALRNTPISCPPLDSRLLNTYFDWLVKIGYLEI